VLRRAAERAAGQAIRTCGMEFPAEVGRGHGGTGETGRRGDGGTLTRSASLTDARPQKLSIRSFDDTPRVAEADFRSCERGPWCDGVVTVL